MSQFQFSSDVFNKAQAGDISAKEEIVSTNFRLVRMVIRRFWSGREDQEDLFQVGCLGLLKAIDRFKPDYGCEFSTYAVHLILGEIRRYLRDQGQLKVSRKLKDIAKLAKQAARTLCASLGREATVREIADFLGVPAQEVVWALESSRPLVSLNGTTQHDEDEVSVSEKIGSSPWEEAIGYMDLRRCIAELAPYERSVINLRYYHGETQEQVALRLGISQGQVSRIENRVLQMIKQRLSG